MSESNPLNDLFTWRNILLFALLTFMVGMLGVVVGVAFTPEPDHTRRDSQGVPCTISTALRADGTPECQ